MKRAVRDARRNPAREPPRPADTFGGPLVMARTEERGRNRMLVEVWENAVYLVSVPLPPPGTLEADLAGVIRQAMIDRRDGNPCMDWRHLQRIKNAVFGDEAEAVEVFPAEHRLVDTSNTRHLWCIPMPIGWQNRMVVDTALPGGHLPQRRFPEGAVPERLDDPRAIVRRFGGSV